MKRKITIYLNAPITICFCLICVLALVLQNLTNGGTTDLIFSTYSSSFLDPMTYVRLICHVFGHADLTHLLNNLMYILILGPMLEDKYHNKLIYVIAITAIVTGLINNIFFPNVQLLGASGVVFAFILLSSITGTKYGIPLTLIIVAIIYIGNEIYSGIFLQDNISQITHIIGGFVGGISGMLFKKGN